MYERNTAVLEKIRALEQELIGLKRSLFAAHARETGSVVPDESLVVEVGEFLVALPVNQVSEVTQMVWVSPLPQAPSAVRGTINYRGRLVPVLDMHFALSGASAQLSPEELLVLVSAGERMFALIVDAVDGVHRFETNNLEAAVQLSSLPSFVRALVRNDQRAVLCVDPAGLLAASELDVLDQLLSDVAAAGVKEEQ